MNFQQEPLNQTDTSPSEDPLDIWGQMLELEAGLAAGGEFNYPATLRGSTANFNVYYNPNLGTAGEIIADKVLATCERDYKIISDFFGGITPPGLPCNVIIASEVIGAYHADCKSTEIYCQAITTPAVNADSTCFALVAEVIELFSAAQAGGWDCEASHGEGLSRVLATELYPTELGIFCTAPKWLNARGRPDYVNMSDPTDRRAISLGCAVLFLNYLHYQLNFAWNEIVQAGARTLGRVYSNLKGSSDGFQQFKALLQAHYPEGTLVSLTTDNPFPLPSPGTTQATTSPITNP
jgi:hypothetical protein